MKLGLAPVLNQFPDPIVIRRTAREITGRSDYRLDVEPENNLWLFRAFADFVEWLFAPIRGVFTALHAFSPLMAWLFIVVLVLILVALIAHIAYSFKVAIRSRVSERVFPTEDQQPTVEPSLFEQQAEEAAAQDDYISGVRYLFHACLLRLEETQDQVPRAGCTNREFLRRYRSTQAFEPLQQFVDVIDSKWYGTGQCVAEDFEHCASAHKQIRRLAKDFTYARRT